MIYNDSNMYAKHCSMVLLSFTTSAIGNCQIAFNLLWQSGPCLDVQPVYLMAILGPIV